MITHFSDWLLLLSDGELQKQLSLVLVTFVVVQWLALLPHCNKGLVSNPALGRFACSLCEFPGYSIFLTVPRNIVCGVRLIGDFVC